MTSNDEDNGPFFMVDLFAGCGGLSLGFEQEGFKPLLFSEINLNAAQTYMMNRLGEDIVPFGDIYSLSNDNLRILSEMWKLRGIREIDLVCGGPPCQGYSGIGHRRTFKLEKAEIPSNQLFREMVRVVDFLKPKAFLFENVKGLLSGRWTKEGEKGEIFRDVLDAFEGLEDYNVGWDLLYAKDYGVPQNRPRVVIVGYRKDVWAEYEQLGLSLVREDSTSPYAGVGNARPLGYIPEGGVEPPSLEELLGDLLDSDYLESRRTTVYPSPATSGIQRLLRTGHEGEVARKGAFLTEHEYSSHSPKVVEKFTHMLKNGGEIPESMQTKKFAQRVLPRV